MTNPSSTAEAPPARSANAILAVLVACVATFTMLNSLIIPVLPTIAEDLNTNRADITWALTAWLLTASIATPLFGKVGDMVGRRKTLMVALGVLTLGNIVAALAPSLGVLILGRVLQGAGGALFPLAFGIIREAMPRERVAGAIGIISAIIGVGSGLGTVLAGPIASTLGWRWLFWLPVITLVIAMVAAFRVIPESQNHTGGRLNIGAAFLIAGWLIALLLPISKGSVWGWTSPLVLGLFALAAVLLVSWITVELRSKNPLIDMKMMRKPSIWTTNLVALLISGAMFGMFAFLPQFVQIPASSGYGFGVSVTTSGLLMLPMLAAMAIVGSFSGPLSKVMSAKTRVTTGAASISMAALAMSVWHANELQVVLAGVLVGLGLGIAYAAITTLIVDSVEAHETGSATGMNANLRTIGGAISTALTSAILLSGQPANAIPTETGFSHAFAFLGIIGLVATLASFLVPTINPRPRRRHETAAVRQPALALD